MSSTLIHPKLLTGEKNSILLAKDHFPIENAFPQVSKTADLVARGCYPTLHP